MTVEVYTRPECKQCGIVKNQLKFYNVDYVEHSVDEVGREFIKENFPGKNLLPIVVVNGVAYSGPIEVGHIISEFKENLGKELLTEDRNDIGRFVNEGGYDKK